MCRFLDSFVAGRVREVTPLEGVTQQRSRLNRRRRRDSANSTDSNGDDSAARGRVPVARERRRRAGTEQRIPATALTRRYGATLSRDAGKGTVLLPRKWVPSGHGGRNGRMRVRAEAPESSSRGTIDGESPLVLPWPMPPDL